MSAPKFVEIDIRPAVARPNSLRRTSGSTVGISASRGYNFEATMPDGTVYAGTNMSLKETEEWVKLLGGQRVTERRAAKGGD